jgi:hypothetical protein
MLLKIPKLLVNSHAASVTIPHHPLATHITSNSPFTPHVPYVFRSFLPSCLSSIPAPNDTSKCPTTLHPDPTKPGSANTNQVTGKSGSAKERRKIKMILIMRLENEDMRIMVVGMMIGVCNRNRDCILAEEEEGD